MQLGDLCAVIAHMPYLCCTISCILASVRLLGIAFFSTSKYFFLLLLRQIWPGGLISPEVSNTYCFWWSVTHIFKIVKVKQKVAVYEFLWLYPLGNFVEWLLASAYLTQVTRLVSLEKGRVTPWLWDSVEQLQCFLSVTNSFELFQICRECPGCVIYRSQ